MPKQKLIFSILAALAAGFFISPLPQAKTLRAMMRPTGGFTQLSPNVYLQSSSPLSASLSSALPPAIARVEVYLGTEFSTPPKIYLPSTLDEFERFCAARRPLGCQIQGKIFLSPRLYEQPTSQLPILLRHELVHLRFTRQLGFWKFSALPIWFNEGVASLVSLREGQYCNAEQDIRIGEAFIPSDSGSLVFPKYQNAFGLSRQDFYQQSAAFLMHLRAAQPQRFTRFLQDVQGGQAFAPAFIGAFDASVKEAWQSYRAGIAPRDCPTN